MSAPACISSRMLLSNGKAESGLPGRKEKLIGYGNSMGKAVTKSVSQR
jgi:hypothetical protein